MTHNSSGWKKAGGPKGRCKVCTWMAAHPHDKWNQRIIAGESILSLAKEFGCCRGTMVVHAGQGKDKDGKPREPHFKRQLIAAANVKDAKAGLDLMECQKEVYDLSIKAAKIAMGDEKSDNPEVKADLRSFGSCISGAAKVVEVLAKVSTDKDDDVPGIDRAIAKMKESRDGQ